MGDNDIRTFRNQLISELNNNPLPIEVKRLILVELLQLATSKSEEVINAEVKLENGFAENV